MAMMQARQLRPVRSAGRRHRKPAHPFQIRHRPWQIQPMLIAPVLPGETMQNLLLQARVVTDPIKNPLIGWWIEYHFFYVKHRDLDERELLTSMMLDPDVDTSSLNSAAKVATYHGASTVDWVQLCLNRVRDTYFRDEDELGTTYEIDNIPIAHVGMQNWMDSLAPEDKYGADVDVDLVVGVDDTIKASEVDAMMRMWELQRQSGLIDMSYEDFLATYGISSPREENHRPELIRSIRSWQYPSNTVEPTTGVPSSAVSWAVAERADKSRFFKEPGFILGVSIARPKVYFNNQHATMTSVMTNALTWLPAILSDDPNSSLFHSAAGALPLDDSTDGYWLDIKDLFLYGEQYLNFAVTESNAGLVALPGDDVTNRRYASATDADGLFAAASPANKIRQDGLVSLDISSPLVDTTPQGVQG